MVKTKLFRIGMIVLGISLAGISALVAGLHKHVTLVIDGESKVITTYALTVGGLLRTEDVSLSSGDELQPEISSWLREDAIIILTHAIPVQVYVDGELFHLDTTERLPTKILASLDIKLFPGDLLLTEGRSLPAEVVISNPGESISLQVVRGTSFTLQQENASNKILSSSSAVGQALWEAGLILQVADLLQPSANTPLKPGLDVQLTRAESLTIHAGSNSLTLLTAAQTIGEALHEAGLTPQGLDYSIPPAEQPIPANRQVRFVRVQEEVIIENTPLPFETTYEAAPDLELDSQSILQTGEYGLTARRVRVRYEDGLEVSRQTDTEWIARQPKSRIVGYGTKVVKRTLNTPDGVIEYYRALTMYATSYCPADVGGNTLTASGQTLRKGLVAINPYYIPYGTRMYVPGYGHAEAADTGLLGPRWIDLGYTDDEYIAWHQNVTVYFLWPPPAQILWIYP